MALPTNLIPANASDITGSLESVTDNISGSLASQIPTDITAIPGASAISAIIPDDLFIDGTIDQIRARTIGKAEQYLAPLSLLPIKKPPFALIKNYVETKIQRIKAQRQKASIKALKEQLKQEQNPFRHRQELKNTQQVDTNRG